MKRNINQSSGKTYWKVSLLSTVLIGAGFMVLGDICVILLLIINCLLQFRVNKKIYIDIEVILLLAGMLSYSILGNLGIVWIFKCTILPVLFYIYGASLVMFQDKVSCEYRAKATIIALSLGLLIESTLNAFSWSTSYGRNWPEFWSGRILPATSHVFYNLLIAGLLFYGIFYFKKNRLLNTILILGSLWILWFSLKSGSRMLILICIIVFSANIALYFYLNRRKQNVHRQLRILLISLLIISLLAAIFYKFNILRFYDYTHSYMWTRDGGILHNIRFQLQFSALKQLIKYPLGGRQMDLAGLGFVHNVWLDAANRSGIFPFILFLIYTVKTLYDLIKLVCTSTIADETKHLFVSSYLSLFFFYMVEAALDANIMYWALWALICGLINGILKSQNNSLNTK